ncbi:Hypothetical predicted protein [Paramuricea clavata]|uniref:Endonuclease/exonuclease/phosphatase domain-containing protein n=1 Tax=Paramuricea clavata TaxID=317549 RepID=A0A7D9JFM9_PARCT|nr:Hypothetical predicted protein [Paramuricea clavata]
MVVFKRKLEWRRFIGVIMWMFMLFIIFWLAKRSKPELVRFEVRSTSTNISIASELARIPDRLCFLWISTRDNILRKSNYPCKHQYGLELQSLNNSLQRNQESSRIVMIGDFNLPSVKWSSYENVPVNTGGSNENEAFCEMVDDNFLQQFISGPTHIAGNKLDLLLCNSPEIIGDVSPFLPECFPTDHYVVEIDVQLKFKRAKPVKRQVFDYKNGSKSGICDLLQPLEIEELSNITLNAEEVAQNETSAALYADDTKVYKLIKSEDDCQILQHALTSLECWSHDNNLDFNQSKCKVLTITRKKTPLVHVYHMNSKELLRVDKEKDLGVCVSANFNWDVHIHTITDLSYATLAKSGLHTLSNSSLESKASKEEPPRGYYNPSMAK